MKVAMISEFPLDFEKIQGGISAVVYYLSRELSKYPDLTLEIISCQKEVNKEITKYLNRVPVHFIPSSKLPYLISNFTVRKWRIKDIIHKINPDLLHLQGQSYHSYPALYGKYPTIMSVHGIMYEEVKYLKKSPFKWIRSYLYKMIEKTCLKKANYIVASNEYAYDKIKHLIKGKKYYLLNNPIDPSFFTIDRIPEKNRILFVGRIEPRKGLEYLVEAIDILRSKIEIKLFVIGVPQRTDYYNKLLYLVKKLHLTEFIIFKGLIDQDKLMEEYSICQLLVLPSIEETSPMVIQQAMAAGVPVIATKAGGIPYLIKNRETGILVETKDSLALANAILGALNNPNACDFFINKAKNVALEKFNVVRIAAQIKEIYNQIMSKNSHQ